MRSMRSGVRKKSARTAASKAATRKASSTRPDRGPTRRPARRRTAVSAGDRAARAALAAALHPIITINDRGIIQSASDSVLRVLGWKPAELVGRNVSILMPEPHHSEHDGYLARYRETGQTSILNRARRFDAVRKDGTVCPIELSISRAEVRGHASSLFVGIIRDLSEQAAAERSRTLDHVQMQQLVTAQTEALHAAHLRLRMSDRLASIGTLAAGLGHDMNNVLLPVRARLNALRIAGARGELAADCRQHVEAMRKSLAYLQQLADGLHFLALDPEASDDGEAVTNLRHWWSQTGVLLAKAVPKHVRLTASIRAGLPEVSVAPHRLTQAMLNLVVNAGEAIAAGSRRRGGRVRVWADAPSDGVHVRLGVTDNGCGMTEEVRRRAFEMFFTTKPRGLGTGLGLPLAHKVAAGAGGHVEIDSAPGKGTTIVMQLRVAAGHANGRARAQPRATIAVADSRAAAAIRHLLEASGASVGPGHDVAGAEILIVEPTEAALLEANAWRAHCPHGALVLLGVPTIDPGLDPGRGPGAADAWRAIEPITIDDKNDFASIRQALNRAMTALELKKVP